MFLTLGLFPLQRSRAKCLSADEGGKLLERSEFLMPPQTNASRGEPKAKLLGGFESSLSGSTATLFGSLR